MAIKREPSKVQACLEKAQLHEIGEFNSFVENSPMHRLLGADCKSDGFGYAIEGPFPFDAFLLEAQRLMDETALQLNNAKARTDFSQDQITVDTCEDGKHSRLSPVMFET